MTSLTQRSAILGVAAFMSVAVVALSISIIAIIRSDLWFYEGWWFSSSYLYDTASETCYMTTSDVSANMCSYGYVVAGVSVFLSAFSFFMQLTKLRVATGAAYALDLGANTFGLIWWLPFAVTATVYGHRATDANLPLASQRRAVWGLSWAIFVCFITTFAISLAVWNIARKATRPQPPQQAQYANPQGVPYGAGPPPSYGSGPPPYGSGPPPPTGYAVSDEYAYGNPVYGAPVHVPADGYGKPGASTRI